MQKVHVPFKGWDLVAWLNEHDGDHMIAVKPIAEAIGVRWQPQAKKISSDPRFSYHHMVTTGSDGKNYEMLCLPVRQLNGWLYSINANKVKPEIREKLLKFQEECHIALHEHLSGQANGQVVSLLQETIKQLQATIEELRQTVEQQGREIEYLKSLSDSEVSQSARRMSQKRWLHVVH